MRQDKKSAAVSFKDRDAWMRALAAAPRPLLSTASKFIGIRLALFLNCKTGRLNPSYGTLAREAGLSKRRAKAIVIALEKAGWLAVHRSRGGSLSDTNSYRLTYPGPGSVENDTGTGVGNDSTRVSEMTPNKRKEKSVRDNIYRASPDRFAGDEEKFASFGKPTRTA